MIFNSSRNDGLATQLAENSTKHGVYFFAKLWITQIGLAAFRGEHAVNQHLGK